MSLVSVNALTYEYPETRALDKVSFTLEAGSITALVGPNGAGKSTLMRCMAALDTPLNGEITIDGKTTEDYPREVHRVMGYLPDTFGVYSSLSVEQTLQYFAAANGVPVKKQADAVAREAHRTWTSSNLILSCRKPLVEDPSQQIPQSLHDLSTG